MVAEMILMYAVDFIESVSDPPQQSYTERRREPGAAQRRGRKGPDSLKTKTQTKVLHDGSDWLIV
jgi:hypothetical protein